MSSRQLRKLQQQRELERAQQADERGRDSDESGEIEEAVEPVIRPRMNLFAALGGDEDDADEGEGEGEDDEDVGEGEDACAPPDGALEPQGEEPIPSAKKSSRKKKKKKSKKAKPANGGDLNSSPGPDDEDEIDRAIRQLKLGSDDTTGGKPPCSEESGQDGWLGPRRRMNELLSVNTHHLRAINEMRSLFGREAIESANAEEQQQEQGNRRRQRMPQQVDLETFLREPPGAKKLPQVSLRRNVFVQGREYWPRQSAWGLTMSEIGRSSDGLSTEYAYVHDEKYDAVQAYFFTCVQVGDPMRLVHFLKRVPYHVSTLLQVSSVAKQDQNMALAAELLERALFTFGRVATSAFRQDMESGRARLDFRRPENRQFWLAGYHYLRSLIRKGTYRTALEWAKLLYALDHGDPFAIRHYIHVLALRAHESTWLVDFFEQMDQLGGGHPGDDYLRQSMVLAKLQANDTAGALELLKRGVQTVPWLYCALFQELNLDAPPSIWGINPATDTSSFWVKMYIYQTKDLWNNAQATALLQQVAQGQGGKIDASSLAPEDAAVDLGSARLAFLEGQTALLAVTPRHLLDSQPNYEFDPLPPPEHDNIFTGEGGRLPWRQEPPHRVQTVLDRGDDGARAAAAELEMLNNVGDDDQDDYELLDPRIQEIMEDSARDVAPGDRHMAALANLARRFGFNMPGWGAQDGPRQEGSEDADVDDVGGAHGSLPGAWPEES
ncbi:hypothetical protein E4U53_007074 [Claviceps sorghi]|nr:hypothetical protein E4U53_007074 [Claviceps sorghi]